MKYYFLFFLLFILSCDSDDNSSTFKNTFVDRITTTDANGNVEKVIDYIYDINDLKEISETNSNGETFISTLNYDNEGEVTSISFNDGTEVFYNYGLFYGNLIESTIEINGTTIKHRYDYDQLQLISDKKYENDVLVCEINYTYDGLTINSTNSCTSESLIIERDQTTVSPLVTVYNYQLLNINNIGSRNITSILNIDTNEFTEFIYNEFNDRNLVLNKKKYVNGELTNIIEYEYDLR
ncbi:hypothetical protein [uncultured Algibacter sp.]|uniref:hypothetical protein n=1 Tax=uncultured Algibacter sp. TaxID=298659 RepID=UPI0026068E96|nr:hypothetical protein [uncultured Algibacter sp.]